MAVRNYTIANEVALFAKAGEWLDQEVLTGSDVRSRMMRAFLKINNKEGRLVPFEPNDAQRKIAERWGAKNIILKARQLGISTYVAARFFVDTITRPGTLTLQVAHDQRAAEDIFRIVHRFQENLPVSLREGMLKTSRANVRQLRWPCIDSEYRVETAADPNAGRGMTIRNLHCSEVAMWPGDGAEALVSLRAAVPPGGQVVLESTPNGAGGAFYEEWQSAAETGFVQHFLPWWVEKAYRREGVALVGETDEEVELLCKYGLNDEQLVFRREIRANCRGKAAQEYAEDADECFLLSGECVFDAEQITKQLKDCEDAGMHARRDAGRELIWLPPQSGKHYIIGVDTAGGGSNGDYSCAQVIDRETGMQCAELHAHLAPHQTAERVMKLGREYNLALIVVERNNHGHAVHESMKKYPNLYENVKTGGWQTTAVTKPSAVECLGQLLREQPGLFRSARLLRECRTFLRHADGSSSAASGAHDDTVMAMAIAQFIRRTHAGSSAGRSKPVANGEDTELQDVPA
jgi:hypothetical protein